MHYLGELQLINYKNHDFLTIAFSAKVNAIVGRNGVGKTNVLDAVHYLSMCKSYLNPLDKQNIRLNQPFFSIQGLWVTENQQDLVVCSVKAGTKKIVKRNKVVYEKLSDHIGLFPVVFISPYDGDLIAEGNEFRRKWLDGIIAQIDRKYLDDLVLFQRILEQRNSLLKNIASGSSRRDELSLWNPSFEEVGERIFHRRSTFIEEFIPLFRSNFQQIGNEEELPDIHYLSDFHKGAFSQTLHQNERRDLLFQYSTVGPQKDEINFTLNGNPIKKFGSQGQQKSYILALRLAQYHYLHEHAGKKPVLLLDDIFDKLDNTRVQRLLDLVNKDVFGQVIITDTESERIKALLAPCHEDFRIFELPAIEA
ncbi:MAG: DNA replication and repair protein RecF [Bacteroidetes bacterium]|nr:DNA replication and repair protein RecF [Bacteroidota bacterium]